MPVDARGSRVADPVREGDSNGMDRLLVVLHNPPDTGRVKVIGLYSSEAMAEEAVKRARCLPGFIDQPDCFTTTPYELDKDHWPRGFVRL